MTLQELDTTLEDLNQYGLLDMINEAYIGKTPILEEAEKQIGKIREKLTIYNVNNTNPDVLKFNRLMEKQFGMELFGLKILQTQELNAKTDTIGLRFDHLEDDMSKFVTGNPSSGYRFTPGNKLCVIVQISTGFMCNRHYTDADIMAILLHEIGHNFADCMYDTMVLYNQGVLKSTLDSLLAQYTYAQVAEFTDNYYNSKKDLENETKAQKKRSSRIITFFKGLRSKSDYRNMLFYEMIFRRSKSSAKAAQLWKNDVSDEEKAANRVSELRQSEIFADKFAAVYGYGDRLATSIYKMSNYAFDDSFRKADKAGGRGKQYNYQYQLEMLSALDMEEHPQVIQRVNAIINTLEAEYKKADIDPKIKEELLSQITRLKKQIEYETNEYNKFSKIEKAQATYYAYINNTCPQATTEEIEARIEKALDDRLAKEEKKMKK